MAKVRANNASGGGGGGADMGYVPATEYSGLSEYKVRLSYKAKKIVYYTHATFDLLYSYDEDISPTEFRGVYYSTSYMSGQTIGSSSANGALKSVDATGFTINGVNDGSIFSGGFYWFASRD